jgi:ferredoxin
VEKAWLRELCLQLGAADAGFVEVGRAALGGENDNARGLLPTAKSLISLVGVSNREAIRTPSRATANNAWHHTSAKLDGVAAELCERLAQVGVRALATTIGFPMNMQAESSIWVISHKPVAVEAGMGHMGTNRNVIHPRFGNFILLDTIVIDAELDSYDRPLEYNPCIGCNLCVAACPVGAIRSDDDFDFFACLNHNYREFPLSAGDWVEALAAEGGPEAYRAKFRDDETTSMLQSLAFEPTYKSAYCMAVCPAGEDVIGPYLADRAHYRQEVFLPLRNQVEPVYVRSGTRAEKVAARNPAKQLRYIDFKPDVSTVANFAIGLRHMFRPPTTPTPHRVIAFRFPDGSLTAILDDAKLTTTPGTPQPADATIVSEAADYITLLHRPIPGRPHPSTAAYTIEGDPAAAELLLTCLG